MVYTLHYGVIKWFKIKLESTSELFCKNLYCKFLKSKSGVYVNEETQLLNIYISRSSCCFVLREDFFILIASSYIDAKRNVFVSKWFHRPRHINHSVSSRILVDFLEPWEYDNQFIIDNFSFTQNTKNRNVNRIK